MAAANELVVAESTLIVCTARATRSIGNMLSGATAGAAVELVVDERVAISEAVAVEVELVLMDVGCRARRAAIRRDARRCGCCCSLACCCCCFALTVVVDDPMVAVNGLSIMPPLFDDNNPSFVDVIPPVVDTGAAAVVPLPCRFTSADGIFDMSFVLAMV